MKEKKSPIAPQSGTILDTSAQPARQAGMPKSRSGSTGGERKPPQNYPDSKGSKSNPIR